ncbi:MAG: hypothetical protein QMD11_11035, partial [Smithella sp.]|nr:hypothetical protein [Smithella sp.]
MTNRLLALFYLLTLCAIIVLLTALNGLIHNARLLQEYEPPTQTKDFLQHIEQERMDELQQRIEELENIFSQAETFTVTAYAPLDPNAIEGFCYSGDPNVTASGGRPIPYQT